MYPEIRTVRFVGFETMRPRLLLNGESKPFVPAGNNKTKKTVLPQHQNITRVTATDRNGDPIPPRFRCCSSAMFSRQDGKGGEKRLLYDPTIFCCVSFTSEFWGRARTPRLNSGLNDPEEPRAPLKKPANTTMDNDDAWAEAFASAQGKVDNDSTSRNSETIVRIDKLHHNSSIASQVGVYRNDVDPRVEPFLPPISTADQESLYELQGPLLGHDNCNMMKPCTMYTLSIKGRKQDEQCAICGSPPGLHLMTAQKNPRCAASTFRENPVTASRLYVAVRNLRCSLRAQPESQPSVTIVKTFQNEVDQLLLTANNGVTNPSSMVGTTSTKKRKKRRRCDQEGSILRSDDKLVEACTRVQEMLPRFPAHDGNDQKLEWAIRAIMACDAIYYRLYYADLTSTSPLVIPHPVQYFGGWDGSEVGPMTNPTREQQQLLQNDPGRFFDNYTSSAVPKLPVSHALVQSSRLRTGLDPIERLAGLLS
jgi:hypothetical protein